MALAISLVLIGCGRRDAADAAKSAEAAEHMQRGMDLYQQGLYPGARAELLRAKSLGLKNADLEYGLAQIAQVIASQLPPDERRENRARVQSEVEGHVLDALKVDPNHIPSLMLEARICDGGWPVRHLEALQYIEHVLRLRPEMDQLRIQAAIQYSARPLPLEKIQDSGKVPAALNSSTQLDFARRHLETVIAHTSPTSPEAASAHFELGWVEVKMGDYERGIAQEEIAIRSYGADPSNAAAMQEASFRAGVAAFRLGDMRRAVPYLVRAAASPDLYWQARWLLLLSAKPSGGYPAGVLPNLRARLRPEFGADIRQTAPSFEDVAGELGVAKTSGAAASGWADVDGCGFDELFVEGCNTFSNLYKFDGSRFTDVTEPAGLGNVDWGFSANLVDFRNSGKPDLYIGRNGWAGAAKHYYLRNDGSGRFTDATAASGAAAPMSSTYVSLAADFDRDGKVDIFLCNGVTGDASPNVLLHNNGDGTFSDWTARCGLSESRFLGNGTIGGAVGDYDNDGWPDIFLVGANAPNRLFHNRGDGTFEEVAAKARVQGPTNVMGYMGFMADFNGDGKLDLLTVPLAPWPMVIRGLLQDGRLTADEMKWTPRLYLNNGNGTFRDASAASGLKWPVGCMGAQIGDLDNDGHLDLIFGTGDPTPERLEPMRVFRNRGDGTFEDVSWKWGLTGGGKGHGITVADFDRDGRLDIYAPYGGFFHCDETPAMLFHNQLPGANSVWFRLVGTRSNRDAIGARITLSTGTRTIVREVTGPTGFGSTNSKWVQFGLGKDNRIAWVDVRWPSGATQRFQSLAINRRHVLTEGQTSVTSTTFDRTLAVQHASANR